MLPVNIALSALALYSVVRPLDKQVVWVAATVCHESKATRVVAALAVQHQRKGPLEMVLVG